MTVIGRKKINLQKNRNIKEYLLNMLSTDAKNLPAVSPMLYANRKVTADQLIGMNGNVFLRLGPGKSIKVTI